MYVKSWLWHLKFRSFINSKVKFLKNTLIICEALIKNRFHSVQTVLLEMKKTKRGYPNLLVLTSSY